MNASHRNTLESIPWLVNERVSDDDRRAYEKHIAECAECREELALQRRIHAAMTRESPRVDYAPGGSLQKLWTRIGDSEQIAPSPRVRRIDTAVRSPRFRLTHWLAAAVIVEAIGITFMATRSPALPTAASQSPNYIPVTTPRPVPQEAVLRVVFAPGFAVNDMNALLQKQQLTVVDGPTTAGVFSLATSVPAHELTNTLSATLAELRSNPSVRFAEPIGRGLEKNP
jgi:anti-sigma factor RsiW